MRSFWQKLFAYFGVSLPSKTNPANKRSSAKESERVSSAQTTCGIQREIRAERKFSIAEVIGREGGSFMKGDSAIPRPLKAQNEIKQFLTAQLDQPTSALSTTLFTWVINDIRLSRQLDTPLTALSQILKSAITEPTAFCEFSRQVAIAQSQLTGERPRFQQLGQPAHPDADYTHASIRAELQALLNTLKQQQ